MLRRVNFYSITLCFAFGLVVLLILAGNRYANNTYRPSTESRKKIRNFLKVAVGEEGFLQPIPTNSYDGSPDIEKLLENTRAKIKLELFKYNFSQSGVDVLEDLVMESGGRPLRSLIISTWRSGTTFLGEVLNSIPGTHYYYEPLSSFGRKIRGPPEGDKAIRNLKDLLKCKYDDLEDFFEFGRTHSYKLSCSTRLWDLCKYKKELCYDTDFASRFCKLFPFQSMKVVRLRLQLIREILDDEDLNVKVILLIRDPRGVIQSRLRRQFCQPFLDCWKPSLLCGDMVSDYVAAGRLLEQYPDRLMILRYEALVLKPNLITHRILKFLELSATESFEEFMMSHTNVEVNDWSSTFRVSRNTAFKWKNLLDYNYVDEIQMACREAMSLWGYRIAHNATHMASKDFNPVEDLTISL